MSADLAFPPGFLWGTASSSHQVEGGNRNNQWARFEEQPGAIPSGQTSGLACDWWRRAESDFDHMAALHLNAHRLSLEWSRIEPVQGQLDRGVLAHYRQWLLELCARGIEPWVALHHFTNPLWFEDHGGWEAPSAPALFQAYVRTVVDALGDLCRFWLTINEPLVYLGQGWLRGRWPPHRTNPMRALQVYRHLLLAHGAAYHTIHSLYPEAQVGMAKAIRRFGPATARRAGDRLSAWLRRYLFEDLWFAATVRGQLLPPLGIGQHRPSLARTLDFVGVNYYARYQVRFHPDPRRFFGTEGYFHTGEPSDSGDHGPYSRHDPDGLYAACRYVQRFGKPIYVTENGLPDAADQRRPRWLLTHLAQLHRALQAGCDVRGYFHWTFVDNFEWDQGWSLRFGLVALDPMTQLRTERPSARVYAQIAQANALPGALLDHYVPGSTAE